MRCALDGTDCDTALPPQALGAQHFLDHKRARVVSFGHFHDWKKLAISTCPMRGPCTPPIETGTEGTVSRALAIDDTTGEIIFSPGDARVVHCKLDGTACVAKDVHTAIGERSSVVRVLVDGTSLYLLTFDYDTSEPNAPELALFRCRMDATACTGGRLALAGRGAPLSLHLDVAIDTAAKKLLLAHDDPHRVRKPILVRCDLDGTNCLESDVSVGAPPSSGASPALFVDKALHRALVVTTHEGHYNRPNHFSVALP